MNLTKRLISGLCTLSVLMFGALATGTASAAEDCSSIQSWVEANQASLPKSYQDFSRFSATYRRAIFGSLNPAEQSALWQEHLRAYRAAQPELTAKQVEFIRELEALATVDFFARPADEKRLNDLQARGATIFSQAELKSLLANVGPSEERMPGTMGIACECSTSSDYCSSPYSCWYATCDYRPSGCGTFWRYPCNGLCYKP